MKRQLAGRQIAVALTDDDCRAHAGAMSRSPLLPDDDPKPAPPGRSPAPIGRSLLDDSEYFPEYWIRRGLEALRIKPHGRIDKFLAVCLLLIVLAGVLAVVVLAIALFAAWVFVIYAGLVWLMAAFAAG